MIGAITHIWSKIPNQLIGFVTIMVTILITFLQLYKTNQWNKKKYALDMIADWNNHMINYKLAINKVLPGVLESNKPIDIELATRLLTVEEIKTGSMDFIEAKLAADSILNYFEFIATSYLEGVAHKKVVETNFRPVMIQWDSILKLYKDEHKKMFGVDLWEPYSKLMGQWHKDRSKFKKFKFYKLVKPKLWFKL
jgi:hypothetical protein